MKETHTEHGKDVDGEEGKVEEVEFAGPYAWRRGRARGSIGDGSFGIGGHRSIRSSGLLKWMNPGLWGRAM